MSYTHGANGISNAAGEYTSTPPLALVLALSLLLSLHLFISSSLHLETQRYFWSQTDVQGRISSDPFGNVLLRACILKVHTHTSASRFMLTSACCSFLMVLTRLFWGAFFFIKKGPLLAIWDTFTKGKVDHEVATSHWVSIVGLFGVCVGLAVWGSHVVRTVGKKLTKGITARAPNHDPTGTLFTREPWQGATVLP